MVMVSYLSLLTDAGEDPSHGQGKSIINVRVCEHTLNVKNAIRAGTITALPVIKSEREVALDV